MQSNNPFTEVGIIIISLGLIAAGTLLLILGKVDSIFVTLVFGLAAGLFGYNKALAAPSPAQQAALQQLLESVLAALPPKQ